MIYDYAIHAGDTFNGITGFVWDRTKTGKIRFYINGEDAPVFALHSEAYVRNHKKRVPNPCGTVVCPALVREVQA